MKPHVLTNTHSSCTMNTPMKPSRDVHVALLRGEVYEMVPSLPLSFSRLIPLSRTKVMSFQLTFCFLWLFGSYHSLGFLLVLH